MDPIKKPPSRLWYYFWQLLYLIPIAITLHYLQLMCTRRTHYRYIEDTTLDISEPKARWQQLSYELTHLRKEIINIRNDMEEIRSWKSDMDRNFEEKHATAMDKFYSDQIGLFDHASEYAGGFVISTPETTPYPSKFGLRLFGIFDITGSSQPSAVLKHFSFPGNCFAFYGTRGRIRIGLRRPVVVTHVSLEYMRLEQVAAAPKDFCVLGITDNNVENLGHFRYDIDDSVIQTFRVASTNHTYRAVELRILSNHGNDEFTCVYRFRVHSLSLNSKPK